MIYPKIFLWFAAFLLLRIASSVPKPIKIFFELKYLRSLMGVVLTREGGNWWQIVVFCFFLGIFSLTLSAVFPAYNASSWRSIYKELKVLLTIITSFICLLTQFKHRFKIWSLSFWTQFETKSQRGHICLVRLSRCHYLIEWNGF